MHSASRIPPTIQSFVVPYIGFDNNCVEHVGCYTSADILIHNSVIIQKEHLSIYSLSYLFTCIHKDTI